MVLYGVSMFAFVGRGPWSALTVRLKWRAKDGEVQSRLTGDITFSSEVGINVEEQEA